MFCGFNVLQFYSPRSPYSPCNNLFVSFSRCHWSAIRLFFSTSKVRNVSARGSGCSKIYSWNSGYFGLIVVEIFSLLSTYSSSDNIVVWVDRFYKSVIYRLEGSMCSVVPKSTILDRLSKSYTRGIDYSFPEVVCFILARRNCPIVITCYKWRTVIKQCCFSTVY